MRVDVVRRLAKERKWHLFRNNHADAVASSAPFLCTDVSAISAPDAGAFAQSWRSDGTTSAETDAVPDRSTPSAADATPNASADGGSR